MRHIRFLLLTTSFMAITSADCQAAGSFQRPEPRTLVTAGIAPSISMPNLTANDLVGGCGKGRVRNPQTHRCLGPADIR